MAQFRSHGQFCWIDMVSPDLAKTRKFWGKVLGWTYDDSPMPGGTYSMIRVGNSTIGGLTDLNMPNMPKAMPPHVGAYVCVDDADAMARKAESLGGRVITPAFDVMTYGRMAVIADPAGGMLSLWEPLDHKGTDVDAAAHGAPSWYELISTDIEQAGHFYADLFDWDITAMDMGDFDYVLFKHGKDQIAGMMPVLDHMGPMPSHWSVYFTVSDCDAATRRARDAGGIVFREPYDIPEVGRSSSIKGIDGVNASIITYLRR
jgi:predicted enzyme related to lactoylglutathione lyase